MTEPELSVIVVTGTGSLADIDSLTTLYETATVPFETIVRTDPGICRARNSGIDAASTDKLVFLDDDAIPHPGYLTAVSRALDDHDVVTGPVDHPDTVFAEFANLYDDPDSLIGCNMAFHRDVFDTVGYFDENLNWGHDETELASRFGDDYTIHYETGMRVTHSYADSIPDYLEKMWRFGPADVYYGRKVGTGNSDNTRKDEGDGILRTLFGPEQFQSDTTKGSVIKSAGRLVRNASIATTVLRDAIPVLPDGTGTPADHH